MDELNKAAEGWPILAMVLATGAVGTAAFGIVEGLKWTGLGLVGFGKISAALGGALMASIGRTYGADYKSILEGYYRVDRAAGALSRTLRQGVRVGARPRDAEDLAAAVGGAVEPGALSRALEKLGEGDALEDKDKSVISRFELAADARIDAALAIANSTYTGGMRIAASVVALVLALAGTWGLAEDGGDWAIAVVIGIAAVPLAPIAKDLASGLQASRTAAKAGAAARR